MDEYQGVRYSLAACLQAQGRDDELAELLHRFDDEESAYWLFTRVLWRYRGEGSSRRATSELKDAIEAHPHVPLYLLGRKHFLVGGLSGSVDSEGERAGVTYFIGGIHHWLKTLEALEWVRENADEKRLAQLERGSASWSLPDAAALNAPGAG
jgi:hypothetical protein